MEIDVSKIIKIPSNTEIPVHNNHIKTERPLCTNFPENDLVIDKLEAIKVKQCSSDLFDREYKVIENIDELKKLLSELLIRFDTNPQNYTKKDFGFLLKIIYQSLLHLYESDPESVIVTEWQETLSDNRIPSERLVKRTIDRINSAEWGNIQGDISDQTDLQESLNDKEDKSNKVTSISSSSTNTQYPSAKCIYDEFTTQVIDKTQDSSSTFAIDPNKMYMFGTRTSLTITLNTPNDNNIVNEYMFQFTSGSTATSLSIPNTVVWLKNTDVSSNKKYLVSIENNLGIIGEWDNE